MESQSPNMACVVVHLDSRVEAPYHGEMLAAPFTYKSQQTVNASCRICNTPLQVSIKYSSDLTRIACVTLH